MSDGTIEFICKTPEDKRDHNHGVIENRMIIEDTGQIKDVINAFALFLASLSYSEDLVKNYIDVE
jgi:hypothetical protein